METTKIKIKTTDELERLNTPNLLRYYKAERKRYYIFVASNTCECCGEPYWYINDKLYKNEEQTYNDWENYLKLIKDILSKREHVKRK